MKIKWKKMHYKFLQYFITSNGNTCLQNGLYIHEINPNTEHLHFKKCFSSRIVMALWLKSLPLYATYENISLYMGWICTSGIYIQQLFLFYWLSTRHRKYDPGVGQWSMCSATRRVIWNLNGGPGSLLFMFNKSWINIRLNFQRSILLLQDATSCT